MRITTALLDRYVKQRLMANGTVNRELAALKRMLNLGAKCTPPKVHFVPKFPHLVEDNIRVGFLEDQQYRKLIEYCPEP